MAEPKRPLRCAVYTRKSTEYGLEQDFNSLDAQREAAEAYIKSQAHEGWRLLPRQYDDGGISGATLDRPALQALLSDIRERKVDVVVVYKVDRLTRSLGDFAKLVELFDAQSVSFVSVTQQFNTTTSMGRLTLNVLLSFAQFEREVTAERIRDKIAASKQKGIWTGGRVPLGYAIKDKKVVVVEGEAKQVRTIFRRYLELGSLDALQEDLKRRGIRSKRRVLSDGGAIGGTPYYKAGLSYLLKNRMYIGEVGHGGKFYPGQHAPIVERKLFDAVQEKFAANASELKRARMPSGSLLMGKLFDDAGNRMSPTNTQKGSARYRYYVSAAVRDVEKGGSGATRRVSAPDIEAAVIEGLRGAWSSRTRKNGASEPLLDDRTLINALLERAVLGGNSVEMLIKNPNGTEGDSTFETLVIPLSIRNTTPTRSVILAHGHVDTDERRMRSNKRKRLAARIAKARAWADDLMAGRAKDVSEIARRERTSERHVRMGLSVAFLAPDLVRLAIAGDLPADLGVSRISLGLPLSWTAQRRLPAPEGNATRPLSGQATAQSRARPL